jgi:hypothetical protein
MGAFLETLGTKESAPFPAPNSHLLMTEITPSFSADGGLTLRRARVQDT